MEIEFSDNVIYTFMCNVYRNDKEVIMFDVVFKGMDFGVEKKKFRWVCSNNWGYFKVCFCLLI